MPSNWNVSGKYTLQYSPLAFRFYEDLAKNVGLEQMKDILIDSGYDMH
jgi:hypothetical protein